MIYDERNNATLKALIVKVEWIYAKPYFNDTLCIVFRVNGHLNGLQINQRPTWTRYGQFNVERSPHSDYHIDVMDRKHILAMVSYINEALLTEEEKAEWQQICQGEAESKAKSKEQSDRAEQDRKRREYERLKKEFGD